MTELDQQITIAEACGWKRDVEHSHGESWEVWRNENYPFKSDIPNYLRDRNAMFSALNTMNDEQWYNFYYEELPKVVKPSGSHHNMQLFQATLIQIAEAFLKTIGKWRDICAK